MIRALEMIVGRGGYVRRGLLVLALLGGMLSLAACSDDARPAGAPSSQYPSGLNGDIDKQLKYDARVQDYETDGDKLIVNVNQSWISSPPGIQERALGEWFEIWQGAHGGKGQKGLAVIARYDGDDVAKFSRDRGYQSVTKSKSKNGESPSGG